MTFSQVSAHQDDTVSPPGKGFGHQVRVDHARTHDPHRAHVGRILQPADTGQVAAGIGAPVAQKSDYFGLKGIVHQNDLLNLR
jgi:hypothetical protein